MRTVNRLCGERSCWRILVVFQAVVATSLFLVGCGSRRTPPPVQSTGADPSVTKAADEVPPDGAAAGQPRSAPSGSGESSTVPPTEAGAEPVDRTQLSEVGPEDAKKGSTISGGGIITEPLKQFFLIQHRLEFIKVDHAEQLYKGEHGRMPRTHEEYMQEIIEANEVSLPELQPGWDYYYDAQSEELMQRRTS